MRIVSISVATISPLFGIDHPDYKTVNSGIKKLPVSTLEKAEPIKVTKVGLEGDEQADFSVHGGLEKAIYAYPSEHYVFWNELLQRETKRPTPIGCGFVGENLSVEGFSESEVWVGDIWQIGEVELQVTKLREPCFKFNARMAYKGSSKAMIQSGKSGWYLQVNQGGWIKAGDCITVIPGRRETSIQMQNAFLLRKDQQNELPL
jgi:MOSC domain-containing protein YiiM